MWNNCNEFKTSQFLWSRAEYEQTKNRPMCRIYILVAVGDTKSRLLARSFQTN